MIQSKRYSRPRLWVWLIFFIILIIPVQAGALEKTRPFPLGENLSLGITTQYYFNSHTSYQFGNPFPPYQIPLSWLEFPMDSWWIGAELRGSLSRFSFGLKALTNVSSEAGGWMKDSDWDDEANPSRRTIYSESRNRMDPSYYIETDIDMKISDWVPLPSRLDLRPLIGYRWQQLNMVTHDGTQWEIGNAPVPLPGNGIRFQQIYNHFFWGFRANLDLGKWGWISRLSTFMQLDWAYVEGSNRDHHLLRAGSRFTYDETSGQAWHEVIGLKAALSKHLALTLKADFIQIDTSGTHRLVNAPLGVDFKMSHGIRVWSEQNSFSLTLDYTF